MAGQDEVCGKCFERFITWCDAQEMDKLWAARAGYVAGQCEKVMLGACRASMFRPDEGNQERLLRLVGEVCQFWGLVMTCTPIPDGTFEIWVYRRDAGNMLPFLQYAYNSAEWHASRGGACGIPAGEIDERYHARLGFAEPCDEPRKEDVNKQ